MRYSIIIPLYNRPDEIVELLDSLCLQTYKNLEILIIEDGSEKDSRFVVDKYKEQLDIKYFYKTNTGPGTTRNYGAERAEGEYYIFFDSDCLIPKDYMEIVNNYLTNNYTDAYGGADAAHSSFTNIQKAISYSMTSFFTTGGIRGGSEAADKFHPRSFNMGFSKEVFVCTKGFSEMRFGEDIDMSIRIMSNGFKTKLIKEAFVYHKRRTDFKKFFKQVHNSGIARINLYKRHKNSLKLVHFFPTLFFLGNIFLLICAFFCLLAMTPIIFYVLLILIHATLKNKSLKIGFLSVIASYFQLFGYGSGFLLSVWRRIILRKPEFHAFRKNFYK